MKKNIKLFDEYINESTNTVKSFKCYSRILEKKDKQLNIFNKIKGAFADNISKIQNFLKKIVVGGKIDIKNTTVIKNIEDIITKKVGIPAFMDYMESKYDLEGLCNKHIKNNEIDINGVKADINNMEKETNESVVATIIGTYTVIFAMALYEIYKSKRKIKSN